MSVIAVDIAILPPDPVKGLAIELSKKINFGEFHLNEENILPHITLGIGFGNNLKHILNKVEKISTKFKKFEAIVQRIDRRYLMFEQTPKLLSLHKLVVLESPIDYPPTQQEEQSAYIRDEGERISEGTIEYTKNFLRRNSHYNWVPHITFGWDDNADTSDLKADLPIRFEVNEVAVCQLGEKNTCRKVLERFKLS